LLSVDKDRESVENFIEVKDLNLFYGDNLALHDLGCSINRGEVTALIGPSGCGKSTFLRAINRMNDSIPGVSMSGSVRIGGVDIYGEGIDLSALRKYVGMVFQRSNPFPRSIFENVAYGPKIHGEKAKSRLEGIVEHSLRAADLWEEVKDRLKDSALNLSGGQQQRLCIARALAIQPGVILMDEPASALDPRSTAKIEDLIRSLKGEYTVVIVTHNMQQAARVSDRTAFFLDGQLVEIGDTPRIFSEPGEMRTKDYIQGRFG